MMLDAFLGDANFPRQSVEVYSESTAFDPVTGTFTTEYDLERSLDCWLWQKMAMKEYVSDKIYDQVDLFLVCESGVDPVGTDYVKDGDIWYKLALPDDVLFAGEVVVVSLKRTEAPNVSV